MKHAIPKLWTAEVLSRLMTALATVYVARTVGVEGYGLIGFAAAILAYLLEFTRFGTDYIIVRNLAGDGTAREDDRSRLRTAAVVTRAACSVPAILALVFLSTTTGSPVLRNLYLAGIVPLLGALVPVEFYLQSEEKFTAVAGYRIVANVFNLVLVLFFVRSSSTSWVVPVANGAGVLIGEALFFQSIGGAFAFPGLSALLRSAGDLARQSLPLLGSMILLLVIGQLGIILVRAFCPADELGHYVAGYKIYDVGNALLVPVSTVLYPALSSGWDHPDESLRTSIVVKGLSISVPLSLLMLGGAWLCADTVVPSILGTAFEQSAGYVSVLVIALFFRSISMFLANALVAAGRQRAHFWITAVFAVVSAVLGIILIRSYGAIGSAWSVVIAFGFELIAFVVAIGGSIVRKEIARKIGMAVLIWSAVFIPLMGLVALLRHEGNVSLTNTLAIGLVFAAAFTALAFRFRLVTPALLRPPLDKQETRGVSGRT